MKIIVEKKNGQNVFKLTGRLDSNTAPNLEQMTAEFFENKRGNLIIDFEGLDYISSAGLRVIHKASKESVRSNCKFITCNMQDHVREVFEISGFDNFIEIYSTFTDALNSLAS